MDAVQTGQGREEVGRIVRTVETEPAWVQEVETEPTLASGREHGTCLGVTEP